MRRHHPLTTLIARALKTSLRPGVIPGSHRPGLHHSLAPLQRAHYIQSAHPDELHLISADPTWSDATFGVVGTELPSTVCEAQPGDVLFCAIPASTKMISAPFHPFLPA